MRSGLEYVNIVSRATKNTANSEGIFDEKDARNDVSSRSSVESCIFKCVVHVSSHSKFTTHVTPNCVVDNRRGFPYGRTIVFFNSFHLAISRQHGNFFWWLWQPQLWKNNNRTESINTNTPQFRVVVHHLGWWVLKGEHVARFRGDRYNDKPTCAGKTESRHHYSTVLDKDLGSLFSWFATQMIGKLG